VLSLAEALAALPTTADDIAAHLHAKGIQGVPEDSCNCPITNHLTGLGFDWVSVTQTRVQGRSDTRGLDDVRTPWWIAEFVERFDNGEWPELVLDDTAEPAQTEPTTTPLER
jgi:hypothetical protein